MSQLEPAPLGISLVILGSGFFLLVLSLFRVAPVSHPRLQTMRKIPLAPISTHDKAVLLIEPGGRLVYSNQQAHKLFKISGNEANLDRLARRTRPSETFLALCGGEGKARFSLDGCLVEGLSYSIPSGSESVFLVALQQLSPGGADPTSSNLTQPGHLIEGDSAVAFFKAFAELSLTIASTQDIEASLAAILECIERLIPSDFSTITVWDEANQHLIPYILHGLPGEDRHLEKAESWHGLDLEFSHYLIDHKSPLLIPDTQASRNIQPITSRSVRSIHSYLGVPMIFAGKLVGTLELGSSTTEEFNKSDLKIMRLVSDLAAVTVYNALTFKEEQRYGQELACLAQLAEATTGLQDLNELLSQIVESIAPLLDVEILGFLIFDKTGGVLRGQCPFRGLPANFLDLYQIMLPAGSPAETVFLNQETIHIANAPDDAYLNLFGFDRVVQAAGIQQMLLIPLGAKGHPLGYMQLANKRDGSSFSEIDRNLGKIVAGQVSPIIENVLLYSQTNAKLPRQDIHRLDLEHIIETSRSRAILEAIAEGVLVTDPGGKITLFNDSAQRILNLDREHVLGLPIERFSGLFGYAAHTWIETIHKWSTTPPTLPSNDTYQEQITLEDGLVVSVNLAPVVFRDEFLGTVSIFHDITHQIELDRMKSEFVATVSHELRTPMTSIKGYVDVLLMGAAGELNQQQLRFLEIIKNNSERLTILVNDLLDISRIESGRVNLTMQPLNLRHIAEDTLKEFRRISQEDHRPMSFNLDFPADLPRVVGDLERVSQIIHNLLSNAFYYTPENGEITLRAQRIVDEVQMDIHDTGIGIPITEQSQIFERFYRGKNPLVVAIPGTGLGLSIAQELIALHQGRLWLQSSGVPGEGSIFSFTLPIYNHNHRHKE